MKNSRRLRIQLTVTAVLALVFAFGHPIFVHRQAYDRAVFNYAKNPSSENQAALQAESDISEHLRWALRAGSFAFFFAVFNGGWILLHRKFGRQSEPASS
jgi:hypothetical protein